MKKFIAEMAGQGTIPRDLRAASSPKQAVSHADIICATTTSSQPIFADQDLKPGVHINGVDSYTPEMLETTVVFRREKQKREWRCDFSAF